MTLFGRADLRLSDFLQPTVFKMFNIEAVAANVWLGQAFEALSGLIDSEAKRVLDSSSFNAIHGRIENALGQLSQELT